MEVLYEKLLLQNLLKQILFLSGEVDYPPILSLSLSIVSVQKETAVFNIAVKNYPILNLD